MVDFKFPWEHPCYDGHIGSYTSNTAGEPIPEGLVCGCGMYVWVDGEWRLNNATDRCK